MTTTVNNNNIEIKNRVNNIITEAEGVKVGDKVKHAWSDEVATVTAIRKGYWDASDGEVWLFTLDFGKDTMGEWKTVLGPFKMELNGGEFRREALTLQPASVISDPDGREFRDFKTWNGMTVKAEERQKWTRFFAEGIINKMKFDGKESTYKHNVGKIRVKVAYKNYTDKPEDWTYCVSWYRWTDAGHDKAEIVECDNGVSVWEAARDMADFHLLADKCHFQTVDEILNPCERPQAA